MFIKNAYKGRNEFWRYLISFIFAFFIAIQIVILHLAALLLIAKPEEAEEKSEIFSMFSDFGVNPVLGVALILIPSFILYFVFLHIIKKIHDRPLISFINSERKINFKKILFSIALWTVLLTAMEIVLYLINPSNYHLDFSSHIFYPLAIVCVMLLPLIFAAETIIFMGYLLQSIGIIVKRPWLVVIAVAVLWGFFNMPDPDFNKISISFALVYMISFGIFLAIITLLDEGTEIAIGISIVNNIFTMLIVNNINTVFLTPALIKLDNSASPLYFLGLFIIMMVFFFIMARKYKWTNWGKILRKI